MILLALVAAGGLTAGFLLLRRVPQCTENMDWNAPGFSIVIPARNEERNLPRLLRSIQYSKVRPVEVIVVDDFSTDSTANVARQFGANVVAAQPLPLGWNGKSWACYQGAWQSVGDYILFLDADTFFVNKGLDRLIASWAIERDSTTVLSVLPYHQTGTGYEQLSLFFNLLMAAGAGGFGCLSEPQLFGQCLFISRAMYFACGGHATVRDAVVENLTLAGPLRRRGARITCLVGRGVLHMRMFPEGHRQLWQSWSKSFVGGAAASPVSILALSALWISSLLYLPLTLIITRGANPLLPGLFYLMLSLQVAILSRQIGTYRLKTCLFYPVPLLYYCAVFFSAAAQRAVGRKFDWRGREV